METEIQTVVALGASNLTRGLHTVVATSRAVWGDQVHVVAALGHGRSYGAHSRFVLRTLPGILDSGLWRQLEHVSPRATRAFVTDVGNDILYGFTAGQVLAWVEEAVDRLSRVTTDITMTDLPLVNIRRVSSRKFLALRSVLFPSSRLSLAHVVDTAERINAGLEALASTRGLRFVRLNPTWYGFDPIHIRPSLWRSAWQEILGAESEETPESRARLEGLRLYLQLPERQWLCGVEQFTPQSGLLLSSGARVSLY